MMRWMALIAAMGVLLVSPELYALNWRDLWVTRDQQAQQLMQEEQFAEAAAVFERPDWRATAWYRAGDFKQSAQAFAALDHETGWYNRGNALAYLGEYRQAIEAYDRALALNPAHQDALHNKAILEQLLQDSQQEQNNDGQDNEKQNNDGQDNEKQNNDGQDNERRNNDAQDNERRNNDGQDNEKQNNDGQDNERQNNEGQDNKGQDNEAQDESAQQGVRDQQQQEDAEQQEANEQWLRLIPDDPAGLMRQKFLRDHLRRQRGWQP